MGDEITFETGNIVRYVGSAESSGMRRGELGEVIGVAKNGNIRIRVSGRPPQYASAGDLDLVSKSDPNGLFCGKRSRNKQWPDPVPQEAKPDPAPADEPEMQGPPHPATVIDFPEPAPKWVLNGHAVDPIPWPLYEDGSPVMLGDWVECGEKSVRADVITLALGATPEIYDGDGEYIDCTPRTVLRKDTLHDMDAVMERAQTLAGGDEELLAALSKLLARAHALGGEGR